MKKVQASMIVLLLFFYMTVSYLVMHPNVSPGYRSYYITRDSDLTLKERKTLQPIISGDEISYADSRVGYDGWHDREPGYRWSAGRSSKIVFLLRTDNKRLGIRGFSLRVAPLGDQRISVFLNGEPVYSGILTEQGQVDITFPASFLVDGENIIRIDCPNAHSTAMDKRSRGIALSSFSFR
jgi:hypothetical protein